ncbi:MAG TPA: gliding motility-associated C-terminal domain-containing protein, partial [Lacibacter sp.]|nr:gliding motility-associated C-terminal domain-containing protein [Lacibacter sp.]
AGLSANNIPNPVATPSVTTRYTVIGFDSLNCFRDSAVVTVSFYRYPIIAMPRDTIIRSGTGIQLLPQISADGTTFLWTPPNGLSCTSCPNPVASPLVTTRYRITASNPGGCASFADVVVQVRCGKEDIFIPNAFTPNGDNRNDYFYIIGNGLQSVKSLRIFNRWGNKVFERTFFNANTPNLGWDGTLRGQPQPPGTYTYVAEALCGDGSIIPLTGTVTLIR